MALNQIQAMQRRSEGGGGLGKILGTVGGAIIGGIVGGPSGAMTGANLGGTAGGIVGGAASKPTTSGGMQSAPMERRLAGSTEPQPDYTSHSPILEESLKALQTMSPEIQDAYKAPLVTAYAKSWQQDKQRGMA